MNKNKHCLFTWSKQACTYNRNGKCTKQSFCIQQKEYENSYSGTMNNIYQIQKLNQRINVYDKIDWLCTLVLSLGRDYEFEITTEYIYNKIVQQFAIYRSSDYMNGLKFSEHQCIHGNIYCLDRIIIFFKTVGQWTQISIPCDGLSNDRIEDAITNAIDNIMMEMLIQVKTLQGNATQ